MDHGGCGLIVGVEKNRVVAIKADPEGFLNRGYICPKGLHSADKLYHPRRLRVPLMRKGTRGEGVWEEISWPAALEAIKNSLLAVKEKHGARAVAFCQGMPKGMEHFVLIRLANLFGSPNVVATQDVCHAPREVTGLHTCGFYPVVDFHQQAKTVVLWGSNITSTNEEGEISGLLLESIKKGTEIILVDPRSTALTNKARCWLQIRPGTDCALALGLLKVIIEEGLYDAAFVEKWTHGFEDLARYMAQFTVEHASQITGVEARLIRDAARTYASSRPAAIQWGNAIEQHPSVFDTARALICLMAICGNLDIPGGNIWPEEPPVLGLGKFVRADCLPTKARDMINAHHGTIPRLMTVPPAYFRKAVLHGIPYPVKAAYMQCTNPLMTYAQSNLTRDAIMRLDFLAVSEVFMTPTASLADIVLPAATHFEFNDIGHYGLGHGYILARPKLVDPPDHCRSDIRILNELGKIMTDPKDWYDDPDMLLEEVLYPAGINFSHFSEIGFLKGKDRPQKYLFSGFKTPTGKVELALSSAEKYGLQSLPRLPDLLELDPRFPLILTSAKSPVYLHSSYRWVESLRTREPEPVVEINPETAGPLTIADGDDVLIETKMGIITQKARITDLIRPDVVCAAYGWWFPEGNPVEQFDWCRSNYNMLTSASGEGKEFGTPCLKGIPCSIRKL
jgi:anaerobic selenocysteine-containing dehydrogenase